MRRREFITLVGGAAVWPIAALAQHSTPVIGFLHPGSPGERLHLITALREGLRAHGYFEGESVTIEYRWA
jgi:putative ABC transport system substrate-binding protein